LDSGKALGYHIREGNHNDAYVKEARYMENRFAAARRRYLRTRMDGIYIGMLLMSILAPHFAEISELVETM
jgi:hypothetical protein